MRTVAMVSQKGGSGKTTIAVHLAVCAERAGKPTLILDLERMAEKAKAAL
jgi:chromosome partitioning protein